MRSLVTWSAALVLLLTALVRPVQAAPFNEDPEALIKIGNDLRRKGDDVRAEGYFQRAYQIAHTPRSAAQLGLVELAVGRYEAAEAHLSEALAADDSWVQLHATGLEDSRKRARAHLLNVELVGAPLGTNVTFANGKVVDLPHDGMLWLSPGDGSLKVKAPGFQDAEVKAAGKAGDHQKVPLKMSRLVAEAPPAAAPPPAAPPPPSASPAETPEPGSPAPVEPPTDATPTAAMRPLRIAGIVVGSVGAATAIVGAIVLSQGKSKDDAFHSPKPYDPSTANYATLENAGIGMIIGGAALVVGGVVMYVVGGNASQGNGGLTLNIGRGVTAFGWEGRF
jgi:hypothetical protein